MITWIFFLLGFVLSNDLRDEYLGAVNDNQNGRNDSDFNVERNATEITVGPHGFLKPPFQGSGYVPSNQDNSGQQKPPPFVYNSSVFNQNGFNQSEPPPVNPNQFQTPTTHVTTNVTSDDLLTINSTSPTSTARDITLTKTSSIRDFDGGRTSEQTEFTLKQSTFENPAVSKTEPTTANPTILSGNTLPNTPDTTTNITFTLLPITNQTTTYKPSTTAPTNRVTTFYTVVQPNRSSPVTILATDSTEKRSSTISQTSTIDQVESLSSSSSQKLTTTMVETSPTPVFITTTVTPTASAITITKPETKTTVPSTKLEAKKETEVTRLMIMTTTVVVENPNIDNRPQMELFPAAQVAETKEKPRKSPAVFWAVFLTNIVGLIIGTVGIVFSVKKLCQKLEKKKKNKTNEVDEKSKSKANKNKEKNEDSNPKEKIKIKKAGQSEKTPKNGDENIK